MTNVIGDIACKQFVMGWATAPVQTEYGLVHRDRGIAEGAPISPALANVYLRAFDAAVHARHGHLVRYADDIAVFCPDPAAALAAQSDVTAALHKLKLSPHATKTYVSSFDTGFSFLGWVFFREHGWPEENHPTWVHPMSVAHRRTGPGTAKRARSWR